MEERARGAVWSLQFAIDTLLDVIDEESPELLEKSLFLLNRAHRNLSAKRRRDPGTESEPPTPCCGGERRHSRQKEIDSAIRLALYQDQRHTNRTPLLPQRNPLNEKEGLTPKHSIKFHDVVDILNNDSDRRKPTALHALLLHDALVRLVAPAYVLVMTPFYAAFTFRLGIILHVFNAVVELLHIWCFFNDKRMAIVPGATHRLFPRRLDILLLTPLWTIQGLIDNFGSSVALNTFTTTLKLLLACRIVQAKVEQAMSGNDFDAKATLSSSVGTLITVFLMTLHYLSCAYHVVARIESSAHDKKLSKTGWAFYADSSYGDTRRQVVMRWIRAYYWASSTILGNDMTPSKNSQIIFNVLGLFLGLAMTSYVTGSITSLLTNASVKSTQRRHKIQRVRKYLRDFQVDDNLAATICSYYEYVWWRDNDVGLFDDLTDALKLRLAIAVKRPFILKCPLFKALDQYLVIKIVTALTDMVVVPAEIVSAQGEVGESMYFVAHGELVVTVNVLAKDNMQQMTVGNLCEGDHFGEAAILTNGIRMATVRAVSFCELFTLTKTALLEACGDQKDDVMRVIKSGVERRKVRTSLNKKVRRLRVKFVALSQFMKSSRVLRGGSRVKDSWRLVRISSHTGVQASFSRRATKSESRRSSSFGGLLSTNAGKVAVDQIKPI